MVTQVPVEIGAPCADVNAGVLRAQVGAARGHADGAAGGRVRVGAAVSDAWRDHGAAVENHGNRVR